MKVKKVYLPLLTIVMIIAVLAGCGAKNDAGKNASNSPGTSSSLSASPAAGEAGKLDDIKKSGKLVLGTSADYPPYEFHKSTGGKDEIIGFDIEIAKEIAKDLGVQLEIKDMKFGGLLAALDANKVDMVISGMTPDADRRKHVDFSKIYYTAVQSVVVKAGDKDKYPDMNALKGKRIGVQQGSTQEKIAKKIDKPDILSLGKISDLMLSLKSGKVDAIIVEQPVAAAYVGKNTDLTLAAAKPEYEEGGSAIAVKKNNSALVQAMDKTIDRLTADKKIDEYVAKANDQVE